MKNRSVDIAVIGGGIVGAATFYKLSKNYPDASLCLLEKEPRLAEHQTGHNSGVIHSGIYYPPGSYKARLCFDGRKQLVAFAQEHGVPHDVCGKIILATTEAEIERLEGIYQRGKENGLDGLCACWMNLNFRKSNPMPGGCRLFLFRKRGLLIFEQR